MGRSTYFLPNEAELIQILEARKDGLTYEVICKRFGLSNTLIRRICLKHGISRGTYEKKKTKGGIVEPKPIIEGYFQFSTPQDHEENLDSWRKWFEITGIKTKTIEHQGRFILYREGQEAVEPLASP